MGRGCMRSQSESTVWYRDWKFWIPVAVTLIAVFICIMLLAGGKKTPARNLIPDSAFAFVTVNIQEKGRGASPLLDSMEAWMLQKERSRLKRFVIKRAFSSFLPERINVIAAVGKDQAKPEILLIVKTGCVIRLAKLFHNQVARAFSFGKKYKEEKVQGDRVTYIETGDGRMGVRAYAIIGNTFVAGSSYNVIENALTSDSRRDTSGTQPPNLTTMINQGSDRYTFFIFADNGARNLSGLEAFIEERYAFALFPTMDAVEMIYGQMNLTPDEVLGSVSFLCNDAGRLREVYSDVKYIYQAVRRVLRPLNIDMEGEIKTVESVVRFDFRVPGYIEAMLSYLDEQRVD
jgi:hypothetical protein